MEPVVLSCKSIVRKIKTFLSRNDLGGKPILSVSIRSRLSTSLRKPLVTVVSAPRLRQPVKVCGRLSLSWIDTLSDHRSGTAPAATSPAVDLSSDREDSESIEDSPSLAIRFRRSDTPPKSTQPPSPSPGCSTNHPASTTASAPFVPPLIEEEKNGHFQSDLTICIYSSS